MASTETFESAHRSTLPRQLSLGGAGPAARAACGLSPLAIRMSDGRAFSYLPQTDTIALVEGEAGAHTVVELDEESWQGLWDSSETVFGLLLAERAKVLVGEAGVFSSWEPVLRVLYEQLPPYDPQAPLIGQDGREIDPTASFQPDDDPQRMADFLRVTGYILVRDVFSAGEVAGMLEAAESLGRAAREDDRKSWWSQHQDGRRVLVRVLAGEKDPRISALPSDPRLSKIVALSDFELEPTPSAGISVLFKQSGIIFDGKADQPWHRDCGLGGHNLMCPIMNGSVFLRPATQESGELRFLPGSWRTAGCVVDATDYEKGIAIEAGPGDFSLHYGDGIHAGTPPTARDGPFRMSVVFEYGPPGRTAEQSQEHYDQLMHEADASALHAKA